MKFALPFNDATKKMARRRRGQWAEPRHSSPITQTTREGEGRGTLAAMLAASTLTTSHGLSSRDPWVMPRQSAGDSPVV